MATTPNLGLSQLTEDKNFDIDTYNGDNLKVDTFAGNKIKFDVLYNSSTGTTAGWGLSTSAADYDAVIVYCSTTTGSWKTPVLVLKNGETGNATAIDIQAGGYGFVAKSALVTINGTSFTITRQAEYSSNSGSSVEIDTIKCMRVIGVKNALS